MWWVGVWTITCNEITEDERTVENVEEQKRFAREYLPQTAQSANRLSLLCTNTTLELLIEYFPRPFLNAGTMLDWGRRQLMTRYKQVKAHSEIDENAFRGIHLKISQSFDKAIRESGQI